MPIKFNRKQWVVAGIVLVTVLLLGILVLSNRFIKRANDLVEDNANISVTELMYCNSNNISPCIVSFGIDADNNMLINLLLPDLSYPDFYLKITRGGSNIIYECQRLASALNNAYCIGENLPPGEVLHLALISTKNNAILAEGSLSIIGLAFPTFGVAIPTNVPAAATEKFVTLTPTQPSYP